jgi:hypothetical protein
VVYRFLHQFSTFASNSLKLGLYSIEISALVDRGTHMDHEKPPTRPSSSDLVPQVPMKRETEVEEIKQATKKLMGALGRLAQNKVRSARDLSQDAYQEIEHSVQVAKTKADRQLKTVRKDVGTTDNRFSKAAKAAWEALAAPQPKDRD